jgi:hypothetical protein
MVSLAILPVLMLTSVFALERHRSSTLPPGKDDAGAPFDIMIKEIRSSHASGAWKKEGWQPAFLQRELSNIVDQIKKTTRNDSVALPVRFADVKVTDRRPGGAKELVVGKNLDLAFMNQSIILADGNAKISFAENCVIVARGAVYVAHGQGNVILAGQAIHVSHDGNPGRTGDAKGSLILANIWLDVSHSNHGGIFSSLNLDIGFANATTIINPKKISISHKKKYAEFTDNQLRVFPVVSNPLAKELTLNSIEYKDNWAQSRAIFTDAGGRRLVVGIGNDFAVEGKARPELADWRVTMISSHFVIVSNGNEDACFSKSRSQ